MGYTLNDHGTNQVVSSTSILPRATIGFDRLRSRFSTTIRRNGTVPYETFTSSPSFEWKLWLSHSLNSTTNYLFVTESTAPEPFSLSSRLRVRDQTARLLVNEIVS